MIDEALVRSVLERWFPDKELSISRAEAGVSTPVFHARVVGESFWVRLGEQSGERRDGEVAVHRHLVSQGVPVPDVVRYEATPPELDRSLALTSHILGVPLATVPPEPSLMSIAIDVGRVLARINLTPVRGFGWASGAAEDGVPVGEHPWRSDWVREYRDAFVTVQEARFLDRSTTEQLGASIERWCTAPDTTTGCLAHGDFDTSHIYIDPQSGLFTGVIDFGETRGADLLYDLGHLLLHDGESGRPEMFPAVLEGYAEVIPLPADVMEQIRIQAMAIGTRALAIQLGRPPSSYRDWLCDRLISLLSA